MFRSLTPLVIPQVFAPVMERERNHRKRRNRSPRPGRAPDQDWLLLRAPVRRPCRDAKSVMSNSGGYARAPPPANIHRPSGTKMHRLTCGETNGLRSPYRTGDRATGPYSHLLTAIKCLHGEVFPFPTVCLGPMEGEHYLLVMRQRFCG